MQSYQALGGHLLEQRVQVAPGNGPLKRLRGCAKIASYHSKARSRSATAARDVESCGIRTFRWTIEQEISIWFSAEDCRVAVAQRVGGAG